MRWKFMNVLLAAMLLAPTFAYAEPLSAGVDGTTKRPLALLRTSKTTQLYQARPCPSKVTAGSLAASYVWLRGERCWKNGGCPSPQVAPPSSE